MIQCSVRLGSVAAVSSMCGNEASTACPLPLSGDGNRTPGGGRAFGTCSAGGLCSDLAPARQGKGSIVGQIEEEGVGHVEGRNRDIHDEGLDEGNAKIPGDGRQQEHEQPRFEEHGVTDP